MDVRPIPDTRDSVLIGSTKEFELLEDGLTVLEASADVDDMLGQNTSWSESYFTDLRTKLPGADSTRRREQHEVTVDNDELSTLCSGLRAAVGHARSTRAVLSDAPAEVTGALDRRTTAYSFLRKMMLPYVTYDTERA